MNHFRTSRSVKTLLIALLFLTIPGLATQSWTLSLSAGPWTAWPLTTRIEKECRAMIEHELDKLLDGTVPLLLIQNDREEIDYDSGGRAVSLSLTRHFNDRPWSLSLEGTLLRLDLPYTLDYVQRLEWNGVTLVRAYTRGSGMTRIRSFDGALGIQYRFFEKGRFHAESAAALHFMNLRGDLSISGQSSLTSVIGDENLSFHESATMPELREEGLDIPKWLVYPSLSFSAGWQFWKSLGLMTKLTFSQGLFLSFGLTAGF